ncbi:MAG: hypothetical protein M3R06_08635, partial [Chloroflexota bacterium]|nr:hypothetical protein [Chloroflexota bacterium]
MNRSLALLGAFGLLLALSGPVTAQEATPEASASLLGSMGYPELRIQVYDDRFELPAEVNAGRTLVVYENVGEESRHSLLMRLPEEVDGEQALA